MKSKLTVAFLTSKDPRDRTTWSGIYYQMKRSLDQQFDNVIMLGPVRLNIFLYALSKICELANKLSTKQYDISRSQLLSKYYASIFEKKLNGINADIIFAPVSSVEIANLNTDVPICYYSDSSVSQMRDYYDTFSQLTEFSKKETEETQDKALKNSDIIIHASKWASDHVIKHYGVDKTQSFTITMGANIDNAPGLEVLESRIINKEKINLLLLGVEWERKGGPIAFEALEELDRLGQDTHLTVCGCIPPERFSHPKMTVIPFLNKNKEDEYKQFLQLMYDSHFLILPTRAECAGIVFAEASAFGVPSITTNTGGIDSMVENHVNGFMLPLEANGIEYAKLIREIFNDHDKYKKLVYSSRAKYDRDLNWNAWGKKVREIIVSEI